MTTGPVPGSGIAIALPAGKAVFWSAVAQAAYPQFVQLKDPNGAVIFTASGQSPDMHSPTQYGQGFFQVDPAATGDYTVWIGVNDGQSWQSVLWEESSLEMSGSTYFGQFSFISEDGADQDYNDTCLSLHWFEYLG